MKICKYFQLLAIVVTVCLTLVFKLPIISVIYYIIAILIAVYIGTWAAFSRINGTSRRTKSWFFGIFKLKRTMRVYPFGKHIPIWFTLN